MFEDHFDELEKICLEAYGGNSELFDNEFLRPMCWLLQELKTAAEVCVVCLNIIQHTEWLSTAEIWNMWSYRLIRLLYYSVKTFSEKDLSCETQDLVLYSIFWQYTIPPLYCVCSTPLLFHNLFMSISFGFVFSSLLTLSYPEPLP